MPYNKLKALYISGPECIIHVLS